MKFLLLMAAAVSLTPSLYAIDDGYVLKVDSSSVYVDWGKSTGVSVGDSFSIWRPGEELTHPVSGKTLGRAETTVGDGFVERVEDQFTIGKLTHGATAVKRGDRTRSSRQSADVSRRPGERQGPAVDAGVRQHDGPESQTPALLYEGIPVKGTAVAIAAGDFDSKGRPQLAVVTDKGLYRLRWSSATADPDVTSTKLSPKRGWLLMDAVENPTGPPWLAMGRFDDLLGEARTYVLGQPDAVQGWVRTVSTGERRQTILQTVAILSQVRVGAPQAFECQAEDCRAGAPIVAACVGSNQILGFALGDWDGNGTADCAALAGGEKLQGRTGTRAWTVQGTFGGTVAEFETADSDRVRRGETDRRAVTPRLETFPRKEGDLLLVPHNIPALGLRLRAARVFNESRLTAFAWTGMEMKPMWELKFDGTLADFVVADLLNRDTPQLWVALTQNSRTTLRAYSLP